MDKKEDGGPKTLDKTTEEAKDMGGNEYWRVQVYSQYEGYNVGTMGCGHYPIYATTA